MQIDQSFNVIIETCLDYVLLQNVVRRVQEETSPKGDVVIKGVVLNQDYL